MNDQELLTKLAELEHEQWMSWARNMLRTENISAGTRSRWEKYLVPYAELPENVQELDLIFAKKSFELFQNYLKENT